MQWASLTQVTSYPLLPPGRSGRLKYANPQDLPSYPSFGFKTDGAAASAAALGWTNRKQQPPPCKPETSASASAAALSAKDFKMAPAWEPERTTVGSKAAALAVGSSLRNQQPPSTSQSTWGSSAANIAFKARKPNSAVPAKDGLVRQGSMHAAKGAMAGARPRASSSPQTIKHSYPDQANAAANALSAATIAHRPSIRLPTSPVGDAGATPFTTMNRQMFTSHPPVRQEVDDRKRADVLHASAVAMAKRMYNQQQKMIDNTRIAHARSSSFTRNGEASPTSPISEVEQPMRFNSLQDAAYRLAQERLAKLQDEHQKNREMQEYYGASDPSAHRRKLGNIRGKLTRRRSHSDSELIDDQKRSRQIRTQMSLFNTKITEVDEQKRAQDRKALLAAAQRNVKAQLQGMDEKLYAEHGRVAPGLRSEWETKAQTVAQAKMNAARNENSQKIDIGGGKFMDREEVDEIAAKRVQPLLDEIHAKAEAERARQAAERLENEKKREEAEVKRLREKEVQDNYKKLREQQRDADKLKKAEVKQEEKLAKAERKRVAKDTIDATKPIEKKPDMSSVPAQAAETAPRSKVLGKLHTRPKDKDERGSSPAGGSAILDGESTSPTAKVRNWLKTRFSRPRAKSSSTANDGENNKKGFIGGATLARMHQRSVSTPSIGNRSSSMREVALAGRVPDLQGDEKGESSSMGDRKFNAPQATHYLGAVGSVTSLSSEDQFMEAKSDLDLHITPPRPIRDPAASGRISPGRESRFSENLE